MYYFRYTIAVFIGIITAFLLYLFMSLIISVIGGYSYREILCSYHQWWGIMFFYWWPSVICAREMYEYCECK